MASRKSHLILPKEIIEFIEGLRSEGSWESVRKSISDFTFNHRDINRCRGKGMRVRFRAWLWAAEIHWKARHAGYDGEVPIPPRDPKKWPRHRRGILARLFELIRPSPDKRRMARFVFESNAQVVSELSLPPEMDVLDKREVLNLAKSAELYFATDEFLNSEAFGYMLREEIDINLTVGKLRSINKMVSRFKETLKVSLDEVHGTGTWDYITKLRESFHCHGMSDGERSSVGDEFACYMILLVVNGLKNGGDREGFLKLFPNLRSEEGALGGKHGMEHLWNVWQKTTGFLALATGISCAACGQRATQEAFAKELGGEKTLLRTILDLPPVSQRSIERYSPAYPPEAIRFVLENLLGMMNDYEPIGVAIDGTTFEGRPTLAHGGHNHDPGGIKVHVSAMADVRTGKALGFEVSDDPAGEYPLSAKLVRILPDLAERRILVYWDKLYATGDMLQLCKSLCLIPLVPCKKDAFDSRPSDPDMATLAYYQWQLGREYVEWRFGGFEHEKAKELDGINEVYMAVGERVYRGLVWFWNRLAVERTFSQVKCLVGGSVKSQQSCHMVREGWWKLARFEMMRCAERASKEGKDIHDMREIVESLR